MKILVIDDEPDIRELTKESLTVFEGIDVQEASNGVEGIEAARTTRPDGILLDQMMPGLSGRETLIRLQADPATSSIPVIMLSARRMPEETASLQALGAAGVLRKPFDPETLSRRVRTIVDGIRAEAGRKLSPG